MNSIYTAIHLYIETNQLFAPGPLNKGEDVLLKWNDHWTNNEKVICRIHQSCITISLQSLWMLRINKKIKARIRKLPWEFNEDPFFLNVYDIYDFSNHVTVLRYIPGKLFTRVTTFPWLCPDNNNRTSNHFNTLEIELNSWEPYRFLFGNWCCVLLSGINWLVDQSIISNCL